MTIRSVSAFLCLLLIQSLLPRPVYAKDESHLPLGLDEPKPQTEDEPALPFGLESMGEEEPLLPAGLNEQPINEKEVGMSQAPYKLPFDLSGFAEVRGGIRTQRDPHERDASLGETRLQLKMEKQLTNVTLSLTNDFLYDPILDHHKIRLEEGQGWLDLREVSFSITPVDFLDLKVGRYILTWGTGSRIPQSPL
jgi:hypothetical protein